MQRISLPQMVEAIVFTSTWPWLGVGMGNSRSSTVLLPGKIAPIIVSAMNLSSYIPQIEP